MELDRVSIRETVKHCSYKPGYTLCVAEVTEKHITVDLVMPSIQDSWKAGSTLALTYSWKIDRSMVKTIDDLLMAVRNVTLLQFETHEMDEWFRYKGERVSPVHED